MDYLLEVVTVPVRDVDRSLAFYTEQVGFTLDVDYHQSDDFRVVQLTPPGSASSVQLGVGLTEAASFAELTDPDGNTWTLQERHHAAGGSV